MTHLLIILLVIPTFLLGQVWENTYGYGAGYSVEQTTDEGYIVIGSGIDSVNCIYMIKTNQHGDTLWTKYHHLNSKELFNPRRLFNSKSVKSFAMAMCS